MTIDEIFGYLGTLPRWVPFKLVWNVKREKFDKIPNNGRHGLSTVDASDWRTVEETVNVAAQHGLSGVGFVMTGGIEQANHVLVGFDFDDATSEFKFPFKTYCEKSPSKVGVRAFAWAPAAWAAKFQDTLNLHPANCAHAEVYIGTSPRFLTVTFDTLNSESINNLTDTDLLVVESWGMHLREELKPVTHVDVVGSPIVPGLYDLSPEQRHLVDGTGKIDRSNILHGLVIKLIDAGVSQEDILATMVNTKALWEYCTSHREDPQRALQFAREEITRAYPKSMTGKREALIGFNEDWKPVEPKPKRTDLEFPLDLFNKAPGLVGEIARWIMTASYTPREEFAYASALSMVACLIGPYCTHGSRNGKMNLYLTLVGNTGTGKNEAIDGMVMLLNETDAKDCMQDFPASEAALRRQLGVTPNILIRVDELAHKLEGMQGNANGSSMGRAILEAYNAAYMPPKMYADSKNSLPAVDNPFVQILGGTTDKVWDVVKTSHMEDGTLNRFIFVCLSETPEYRYNSEPTSDVPKDLKDRMNAFWRAGRMSDLVGDLPGYGRKVQYSPEIKPAVEQLNRAIWDLQQQPFGNLYTRYVQNTLKIATILAVGDGSMQVSMKYFEQAQRFMKWSVTNTAYKIEAHMADSAFERLTKRFMAKLDSCGGKIGTREAYKFMHITRREMEEMLITLENSGLVAQIKGDEAGKNGYIPEWIIRVGE
jgi:hypothetical protein